MVKYRWKLLSIFYYYFMYSKTIILSILFLQIKIYISFERVKLEKIRPACPLDNLSPSNKLINSPILFRYCYWKRYLYEFYTGNLEFGFEGCHNECKFFFLWTKIVLFIVVWVYIGNLVLRCEWNWFKMLTKQGNIDHGHVS